MEKLPYYKVFTNKTISLATFFGGPISAGFLISKNFKAFGNEKASKASILIGTSFTLILSALIITLPESIIDKIPQALIPFAYTAIIAAIVEKMQGEKIKEILDNNGEKASGWTAFIYGLLGLVLNVIILLTFVYSINQGGYEKQLNINDKVVLHYTKKIKDNTPQRISEAISKSGFMAESEGADVLLLETDNNYILKFILPDENLLKDSSIIYDFNGFENYLNYNLNLVKKIEIKFTDPNIEIEYELPEIIESKLMTSIYKPIMYLEVYEVNENHKIYYNSEMPIEDVKILETAISKLKGYFPVNQVIDIIFLNNQNHYVLKFFVNKDYWTNSGAINRIRSTAEYVRNTGIEKEIKVVFVDNKEFSEKEVI